MNETTVVSENIKLTDDAIMRIIMVIDMVMMGLAMVMVEMDLEPRKAVNMAEDKKRKIKNVTIAVKLTVCVVFALHVVEISVFVFVLNVVISLVSVMITVCIVAMIHVFSMEILYILCTLLYGIASLCDLVLHIFYI
jgi:phosphatidylglycerophosphate synthase